MWNREVAWRFGHAPDGFGKIIKRLGEVQEEWVRIQGIS